MRMRANLVGIYTVFNAVLCKNQIDFLQRLSRGLFQDTLATCYSKLSEILEIAYLRAHEVDEGNSDGTRKRHPDPDLPADVLKRYTSCKDGDE
jgi:hypothetical protein